jgi:signal transduction histidine kinase
VLGVTRDIEKRKQDELSLKAAAAEIESWKRLIHPEDLRKVTEILNEHLEGTAGHYETIHRLYTKDGTWKEILDRGMVVKRSSDGHAIRTVGVHLDVSNQVENERNLKKIMNSRDKLFTVVAHDLRGPIGNFIQVLELLTGPLLIDEERRKKYLEGLKKSSVTTLNLLDNLFDWSRCQTNTLELKPDNFLLNEIINDNMELYKSNAANKSIDLSADIGKPVFVHADKDSINAVIRNLLKQEYYYSTYGTLNEKVQASVSSSAWNLLPKTVAS